MKRATVIQALLFVSSIAALAFALWIFHVPDTAPLSTENPLQTSYMRYRNHPALEPTRWRPLEQISPLLSCAVVKAEDPSYFHHEGFLPKKLKRKLGRFLAGDFGISGASTITQQLARNLYLTPSRNPIRKFIELRITKRLEGTLDKSRMLEIYLNTIEWGDGIWGVENAARHYLNRSAYDLTPFEAAFLAALIPSPRSPVAGENLERIDRLLTRIIDELYLSGLIEAADWRYAQGYRLAFGDARRAGTSVKDSLSLRGILMWGSPPDRIHPEPLPLAHAIAEKCGRHRELDEIYAKRSRP